MICLTKRNFLRTLSFEEIFLSFFLGIFNPECEEQHGNPSLSTHTDRLKQRSHKLSNTQNNKNP